MADDLIELVAPAGCDEANHGRMRYRVDNDGRIRVSREAADWLIRRGGFRPAAATELKTNPVHPSFERAAPQKDGDGAETSKPIPAKPTRNRGATEE
jgi:hypothetical protein